MRAVIVALLLVLWLALLALLCLVLALCLALLLLRVLYLIHWDLGTLHYLGFGPRYVGVMQAINPDIV